MMKPNWRQPNWRQPYLLAVVLLFALFALPLAACEAVIGVEGDGEYATRGVQSARGPLVVLIHGYGGSAEGMRGLEAALTVRGVDASRIVRFDYSGVTHEPLQDNAERLRTFLRRLAPSRVDLIGHSLGGMLARTFSKAHCGANATRCDLGGGVRTRLRQIFTIASPNSGTGWWWLLEAPVRDQLAPGCRFLHELNRGAQPRIWMFAATFDVVVFPWWNAHWRCPSCRHLTVVFAEHNSILDSAWVQDRIAGALSVR